MRSKSKTNILVCGLLWSGSSAVTDLLKEYNNIGFLPGEFNEFRRPGMIGDHLSGRISPIYPSNIPKYLNNNSEYFSLKARFKKNAKLFLKGNSPKLYIDKKGINKKRFELLIKLKDELTKDVSASKKIKLSNKWISDLGDLFASKNDHVLFDQPILHGQHKAIWPEVFQPFKLIVVYRDPRDQMAEIIRQGHLFYHMRSPIADIYGGGRRGAIAFQIDTLKARINHMQDIYQQLDASKVVFISFESLIEDYEKSKNGIEQFLNIDDQNHFKKMEKLNPEDSIKNIGIHNEYLSDVEISMLDELYQWYNSGDFNTKINS